MGASPSKPQEQKGNADGIETTPLLPQIESGGPENEAIPRVKSARTWCAINAVTVFMTMLIAAAIIILCVFFGGESVKDSALPLSSILLALHSESYGQRSKRVY